MSELFEILNPGYRHTRDQKDLDKILVVEADKGGAGPQPLDLDAGQVNVVLPTRRSASGSASVEEVQGDAEDDRGNTDSQEGR